MRFDRWTEFLFHSQMNLNRTAAKPATSTLGKVGGLGDFDHSTEIDEESSRGLFLCRGHGELNVRNS